MKRKCNWCGRITKDYISTPLGVCCNACHNKMLLKIQKKNKEEK